MKAIWKRLGALLFEALLCGLVLSGCSSSDETAQSVHDSSSAAQAQTFRASDLGVKSDTDLSFPFLGLAVTLPESLGQRMDSGEVLCQGSERTSSGAIQYAYLWWDVIPAENRSSEFALDGSASEDLNAWFLALERVGTIGVFHKDLESQLSVLTGGDTHTILKTSGDYLYVLSLRDGGDQAIAEELRQAAGNLEFSEMVPFSGNSAFDAPRMEVLDLGTFTMETIAGESVTQELFSGHKLTLVNLFTTWCSPCVQEIPELEELSQTMAEQGVQVIGVVLDARDSAGNLDDEAIEKAKVLQERTGASYPFLIPDTTLMNGRLAEISAVPETFFVDEHGTITGSSYVGARDLAAWTEIVEAELAALEGGA